MKIRLKMPTSTLTLASDLATNWNGEELTKYLLEHPAHALRPKHVVAYEMTFGKRPPETADAWDVRCAVFYEQALRIMKTEGKKPDASFLKHHNAAIRFGTREPEKGLHKTQKTKTPDVEGVSPRNLQLIFHTCGHKVGRAVTLEELKFAEQMLPCHRCAPRASLQNSNCMGSHVANHPNARKEAQGMSKTGSKKGTKEGPIGKGLHGKTSGLTKTAFFIQTLKENEKTKRSDVELQKLFDTEFPGTTSYRVSGIRSKMNRSGFGEQNFVSKVYGEVVPVKRGRKAAPASVEPTPSTPVKRGRKAASNEPAPESVAPVAAKKTARLRVPASAV